MNPSRRHAFICIIIVLACARHSAGSDLSVIQNGTNTELSFRGNEPFRITESDVTDARLVQVPGTEVLLALWNEAEPGRDPVAFYAISLDGMDVKWVRRTSYDLELKYARFDPLDQAPQVEEALTADSANELYMVQFVTQPLSVFRNTVAGLGADIYGFISNHAYIMRLTGETKAQVEALPFVRTVLPYHPAYRLERYLRENLDRADELFPLQRYNIMVFERGVAQKTVVADRIRAMGGTVNVLSRSGFLFQATLTPEQLLEVIRYNEVRFIDRHRPAELFMDLAREIGGGNYVEAVGGYTGQGVIGAVLDANDPETTHQALTGRCAGGSSPGAQCANDDECSGGTCERAPIPHYSNHEFRTSDHATIVYGIIFGDGTGAPPDPDHDGLPLAKGMLPEGQGIFSDICGLPEVYDPITCTGDEPEVERECLTCELVCSECETECAEPCGQVDPSAPFRAVFQNNSWGNWTLSGYQTLAFVLDDILFRYDLLTCHAIGNNGKFEPPQVCPKVGEQAWAKNVVTVGGAYHDNKQETGLHTWDHPWYPEGEPAASYGLAPDDRIKPDFTHFFDWVLAPKTLNTYTYGMSERGTSLASPIVCGHFGLFFQMWADDPEGDGNGVFGNPLTDPTCDPELENCVFKNRPHMTTAKAMMINTATPYVFAEVDHPDPPGPPNPDLTRDKQGWGLPDVGRLYVLRDNFLLIVNETTILHELTEGAIYPVDVPPGAAALRATLTYADPPGEPSPENAIVNDLTLRIWSPSGACYFGNHGLLDSNWSAPSEVCDYGTSPDANEVDTVENVFVRGPDEGTWWIDVIAALIAEDGRPETPGWNDVDFALVVSFDFDCNGNGQLDSEDIARGLSEDYNENAVPDECEVDPPVVPPEEAGYAKNRYLSLSPDNPGVETAIRVTLVDCAPFPEAEGQWWLGEPEVFCESAATVHPPCPQVPTLPNQFMGAKLQCTPYYMDWHGVCEQDLCVGGLKEGESCGTDEDCRGVVHVYGVGTVPSAWTGGQLDPTTYAIQAIHEGCSVGIEEHFSTPLEITMARWGDIVKHCVTCPCLPPDGLVGVPTDVTAVLDKFKNLGPPYIPCPAVMKVRADVDFDCPNRRVDISDVTFVYDAFRGVEYPPNYLFQGPDSEEWPCP